MKGYLLPASILIGCCILALGLYLGLQRSPPAPPATGATASADQASAPRAANPRSQEPLPEIPRTAPPAANPQAQEAAQTAARAAIEAEKKSTYVPRCWLPALKANPTPPKSEYLVEMAFDAQGKELMRGLSEERGKDARPDVAQCIRALGITTSIPPPGAPVMVRLQLVFP